MDLQLIQSVAVKIHRRYVAGTDHEARITLDDLIQQGVVGYLEADKKFCPEQGGKTETSIRFFYQQRIEGSMIDLVRKLPVVRMPQTPANKLKQLKQAETELKKKGVDDGPKNLSSLLGWSEQEISRLQAEKPILIHADKQCRDEEGAAALVELLPGAHIGQLDTALNNEISALIEYCLDGLESSRHRLILLGRYLEEIKLQELADRFNCTAQAVHYQEQQALAKMRDCLHNNGWNWDGSESEFLS